mmetsp:Transcript_53528/g.170275  ORF Transcript_53528/g.170275 Transcript_53528/m.170275 type:complete len:200 (+) Transcript_53528:413-1012(+)
MSSDACPRRTPRVSSPSRSRRMGGRSSPATTWGSSMCRSGPCQRCRPWCTRWGARWSRWRGGALELRCSVTLRAAEAGACRALRQFQRCGCPRCSRCARRRRYLPGRLSSPCRWTASLPFRPRNCLLKSHPCRPWQPWRSKMRATRPWPRSWGRGLWRAWMGRAAEWGPCPTSPPGSCPLGTRRALSCWAGRAARWGCR